MLSSLMSASLVGAIVLGGLTGSVLASCPGDLNGDGIVDAADIASLLANWGSGTGDLDGDGIVSGSDLGFMLAFWGSCAPVCDGYQAMSYQGTLVGGAGSPLPPIVINGEVVVLPNGEPQGTLLFITGGSIVFCTIAQGATSLSFDDGNVFLPSSGPVSIMLVDGLPYLIGDVLDQFAFDVESQIGTSLWPLQSRAVLLLAALMETQPYCCNLEAALASGTQSSFAYWAKLGSTSMGGAIVVRGVDGCDDIDGCTSGGTVPVGKFPMPCQVTDPLCNRSLFAGGNATYDAVMGLWEGQ